MNLRLVVVVGIVVGTLLKVVAAVRRVFLKKVFTVGVVITVDVAIVDSGGIILSGRTTCVPRTELAFLIVCKRILSERKC